MYNILVILGITAQKAANKVKVKVLSIRSLSDFWFCRHVFVYKADYVNRIDNNGALLCLDGGFQREKKI